jgi:hypothetical protein
MEDSPPGPEVAFFAACQEARRQVFPQALPESPPPTWASWYREALAVVGGDEARLKAAWGAYLSDDWARKCKPVCPAKAFCAPEVWRRHVPGQDVLAPGAPRTSSPHRRGSRTDTSMSDWSSLPEGGIDLSAPEEGTTT